MPSLEFTLMVGCPLMCTFCPQDKLRAEYGDRRKYFQLDDFIKILSRTPKHVRIDFSGMAEPWANPAATDMLRHALESDFHVAIYTTLYGMENPEIVAGLISQHVNQIEVLCLHLPDDNGNMRGWKSSPEYHHALATMLSLRTALPDRFHAMTMDAGGRAHRDLAIDSLAPWFGITRGGNVDLSEAKGAEVIATPRHGCAVSCSFTHFYDQNVVLPNGDVVLCCMDYALQHKIGNLLTHSYYEMFEGSTGLAALVSENMNPQFSKASLCKSCERAKTHSIGASHLTWQG